MLLLEPGDQYYKAWVCVAKFVSSRKDLRSLRLTSSNVRCAVDNECTTITLKRIHAFVWDRLPANVCYLNIVSPYQAIADHIKFMTVLQEMFHRNQHHQHYPHHPRGMSFPGNVTHLTFRIIAFPGHLSTTNSLRKNLSAATRAFLTTLQQRAPLKTMKLIVRNHVSSQRKLMFEYKDMNAAKMQTIVDAIDACYATVTHLFGGYGEMFGDGHYDAFLDDWGKKLADLVR